MKIAIPVHGSRVMPRFGCTREIIIVTVENNTLVGQKRVMLTEERLFSLPSVLTEEQVSVVICGGIHPRFQHILRQGNIEVVWGVIGDWEEVLRAYLAGTLQSNPMFCPHHGHHRGHRFRGRQQPGR